MFSTDGILGRNFAIASSALDGLAMRQQLHTENLANIDTEGYRAKTVNFERVLGAALNEPDPGTMAHNPFGASRAVADASDGASLSGSFAAENKRGKAGVDRTTEVSDMMNDNIRFRVITQQVTNQISAVRSVIAEMGRG
ncbi:MAG: flagellar basal body rod protein FlgB [Thermoleophilia bacterium]|nr:flagellar basal body rod protein FlgB [Thermoleophilia bacterium]